MRVISEGGVWVAEDQAFYVGEVDEVNGNISPDLTSPAQPAAATPPPAAAARPSQPQPVVRRKSTDPLTDAEISWFLEPGGILDQMAAAETRRPYRDPICRSGETIAERDDRLRRFREMGPKGRRRFRVSNDGAVAAVLTDEILFGSRRDNPEIYPAGTECLLFPGRSAPECDPEAAEILACLKNCGGEARRKAVVRLGGRLRVISENQVKVA